jgi:hypothetical protein
MSRRFTIIATATAAIAAMLAALPAEAGMRGRTVSVQGSGGRGYFASRSIARQPGSVSAGRTLQTNAGRGITSARSANWGDGNYSGGATHVTNNGTSFGRSTNITNNGDGTASYSATRNRIDGSSASVSGTVSRNPQ